MATATAVNPSHLVSSLHGTSRCVKGEVDEIMTSGKYYVTPELKQELRNLKSGINQMEMDTKLLTQSKEWRDNFDRNSLMKEKCDAVSKLGQTAQFLGTYKQQMGADKTRGDQENQLRQKHHWAMQNLQGIQENMGPNTHTSYSRLQQFADHVGVTDRFNGYRNNLTRPRHQVPLESSWTKQDQRFKQTYYPQPVFGPSRAKTEMSLQPSRSQSPRTSSAPRGARTGLVYRSLFPERPTMHMDKPPMTLSVQERCGINTMFPGGTEYMDRYRRPPLDPKTSPFVINPPTDFMRTTGGRPLMDLHLDPNFTEYQTRYEWPDGSTNVRLPWLKK